MIKLTTLTLLLLNLGLSETFSAPQDSMQAAPPATRQTAPDTTIGAKPATPSSAQSSHEETAATLSPKDWIPWAIALFAALIAFASLVLSVYLVRKKKEVELRVDHKFKQEVEPEERKRREEELRAKLHVEEEFARQQEQHDHAQKIKTAEERYRDTLEDEVCQIQLAAPGAGKTSVRLLDTFVRLGLSAEHDHGEEFPRLGDPGRMHDVREDLPPDEVMQQAFHQERCRLLLLLGDPGSGKTTLVKYYAMCCLQPERYRELGFGQPIFPLYLPLREVDPEKSLAQNLAHWADKHDCEIPGAAFQAWLHERDTLVLLDGLDEVSKVKVNKAEVSGVEARRAVCAWIDNKCAGHKRSRFVVTSRGTGMRGADNLILRTKHLHAQVRDFSPEQKREFLRNWFRAAHLEDRRGRPRPNETEAEARERRLREAARSAEEVIAYLEKPANRSLRELAGIPMLLQLLALIWKEYNLKPENRTKLYDVALDYLLEYRDDQRGLAPLLPADKARRVLLPAALWMQEDEKLKGAEEVAKNRLHAYIQPILEPIAHTLKPEDLCANLRDRAGVIADYGKHDYIFRHKSFREYFAGLQLAINYAENQRLARLAETFGEEAWAEPLRFFMSRADAKAFNAFMAALFDSPRSRELNDVQQDLLQNLVREAAAKPLEALLACLHDESKTANQQCYALDCLKTIGGERVQEALHAFIKTGEGQARAIAYASEIAAQLEAPVLKPASHGGTAPKLFEQLPPSFRNPVEYNVEYILIRGGTIKYSVTEKIEKVPDLYFAKYPVTNKQYRRFIRYLQNEEPELSKLLVPNGFAEKLLAFASSDKAYVDYLSREHKAWPDKLKSAQDAERKFNGEEQPVVGVSWYAARAYCLWLTELHGAKEGMAQSEKIVYRLPQEVEWERAATGRIEDGPPRKYPWPNEKGEPNEKLANYDRKVGQTTPVGRYSEGATPEGLMDMAGNVWEWQENWYSERKEARALRGGSWGYNLDPLRGVARDSLDPVVWSATLGFRVACASSPIF